MMLIGDGVTPGNEGRGYVLRRLLRRAVRSMRLLGVEDRVLPELFPVSRDRMSESYPSCTQEWERISTVAYAEEEAFRATLQGRHADLRRRRRRGEAQAAQSSLGGDQAFALHDTYGFPIDLTLEMASEQGLSVDEEGFRRLMTEQRERAKADAKAKKSKHGDTGAYREVADTLGRAVEFTGYDEVVSEATVRGTRRRRRHGAARRTRATRSSSCSTAPPSTPRAAASWPTRASSSSATARAMQVLDVQSPITGLIVHQVKVLSGEVVPGEHVQALVDVERRRSISRAHTATHMVHKAFREALGDTATQAGSENAPGRFRFDFSATGAVPGSVLHDVEARVNDLVLADLPVHAEIMTQSEAVRSGAMALFGEKYGDEVRVVSVGDWARELCGGTHTGRSAQLGVVKLLGESSIGSGVRRVEALVGRRRLPLPGPRARAGRPAQRGAQGAPRGAARAGRRPRGAAAHRGEGDRAGAGRPAAGLGGRAGGGRRGRRRGRLRRHRVDGADAGDVRKLALDVRGPPGRWPPGRRRDHRLVRRQAGRRGGGQRRGPLRGISANALVKAAATALGGSGGGKDDVAQGGGADGTKAEQALADVREQVARGRARVMRRGVRLGVDVGDVRIGVAALRPRRG